jgi:hypothetical protein
LTSKIILQKNKNKKFNDLPISCIEKDLIGTSNQISLPIERIEIQQTSI